MIDNNDIQKMAEQLPDIADMLQQQLAQGNPALATFIKSNGITTMDQLATAAETGQLSFVPDDVKKLIEHRAEEAKEREASNNGLKHLVAETFGLGGVMLGGHTAAQAAEAKAKEGASKPYSLMDEMEKAAFLDRVSNMSYADWQNMSQEQKLDTVSNTQTALTETLIQNKQEQDKFRESLYSNEHYGLTEEERKKNVDTVLKNSEESLQQAIREKGQTPETMKNLSAQEINNVTKRADEIAQEKNKLSFPDNPDLQNHAAIDIGVDHSFNQRHNNGERHQKRLEEAPDDVAAQRDAEAFTKTTAGAKGTSIIKNDAALASSNAQNAHDKLDDSSQKMEKIATHGTREEMKKVQDHLMAKTDNTMREGILAAKGDHTAVKAMEEASVDNLKAGEKLHEATRDLSATKDIAFSNDAFAEMQPTAAPRLTINGQQLASAGLDKLGAPEQKVEQVAEPVQPTKRQAPANHGAKAGGMG